MIKKCKRQVPSNKESKQGMFRFEAGGMVEKMVRPSVNSKETAHRKTRGMQRAWIGEMSKD